ncbi:hypothetical protein GCM10010365_66240 [Streptomyces poonensis]|uniref:Uncharacterized protein n=1 Tax=Streptomyces poonensis TaxID=68255 RepID=A0A918Q917_9ACTN|nr:hypothetical protein GCM10010365_66240 [Streptomyces poonensis]GLJ90025.1 hypothetical protein GCM10017589_26260 [Streptomyces poonensis]
MRTVRWGAVLGLGALWWWGVLRTAFAADAGLVEATVAAGGWGLSLLPVHCVPSHGEPDPVSSRGSDGGSVPS